MIRTMTTALALTGMTVLPLTAQQQRPPRDTTPQQQQRPMQMCPPSAGEGMTRGQEMTPGHEMTPGQQMMGGHGMMGGGDVMGMMGYMALMQVGPGPEGLLGAAQQLELDAQQETELERLAQTARQERMWHMRAAMDAHRTAAEALGHQPADLESYEQSLGEAAGHFVQAMVAHAQASVEARDVLTSQQQTRVSEQMDLIQAMMCGMMG